MSDTAQGPGWWQASDGRWYPPETHPDVRATASPTPPAAPGWSPGAPTGPSAPGALGAGAPGGWSSPGAGVPGAPGAGVPGVGVPGVGVAGGPVYAGGPAPGASKGMSGAAKALIAIALVLVVGVGGCTVAGGLLLKSKAKSLTGGGECPFLTTAEAASLVPGKPTTMELRGVTSLVGLALDQRVLAKAPSCMFTPGGTEQGPVGRVARLVTGDASKRFAAERTVANGVKEDRGNGLSVESDPYFLREVEMGDEAFCTTASIPISSGVLVRQGDTLVYVSLYVDARAAEANPAAALGDDEGRCTLAGKIAAVVLNH